MSRPLRIEYKNAWYHVMNRGQGRKRIFYNDKQREQFLELLNEIHNRYRVEIHAYCLMGNHYHLLVRTPLGNISRAMRHLNGVYTQRFNKLQKTDGPLFRGRFKSILVDADTYLLRLSRYIHLNPVAASIIKKAELYPWSSCWAYVNPKQSPCWLHTKEILSYFGKRLQRQKYHGFINEGIDKEIDTYFKKIKRAPILGSEAFTKTITEKYLQEEYRIREIPEHKALLDTPALEDIFQVVANYYKVDIKNLKTMKKREGNLPRKVAMYLAQTIGQFRLQEIANRLTSISGAGVSQTCRRLTIKQRANDALKNDIAKIKKLLQ